MRDLNGLNGFCCKWHERLSREAWLQAKTHSRLRHFFPQLRDDVAELHRAIERKSPDAAYWYALSAVRFYRQRIQAGL